MQMRKSRFLTAALCALLAVLLFSLAACRQQAPAASEAPVRFQVSVVDLDGKTQEFSVETTEKTVGAALLARGLIAGEPGDYGLYVKTVGGVTLDYDADGAYWAFYINGEYAMTGVDSTPVDPAAAYMLKAEKSAG